MDVFREGEPSDDSFFVRIPVDRSEEIGGKAGGRFAKGVIWGLGITASLWALVAFAYLAVR